MTIHPKSIPHIAPVHMFGCKPRAQQSGIASCLSDVQFQFQRRRLEGLSLERRLKS